MKAWKKIVPAVAVLGLVLTACGQGNSNKSSDSSSKEQSTKMSDSSSSSSNDSSSNSSSDKSSSNESSSNSSSSNGSMSSSKANSDNSGLGNEKLPRSSSEKSQMNGNNSNYNVKYSSDGATFNKKTYNNSSEASQNVDYQSSDSTKGLPSVDLGYNVKGHEDRGAGQAYVSTNFGNWSLVSHGNTQNGGDSALSNAKAATQFIQSNALPIPQGKGSIKLENDSQSSVTWQEGNVVYTVKAPNVNSALKMATSIK
ncbi:hypothetical protein MOO46_05815 [Apilactobacillus apisilvae]|uniref:Lipoprotein n=1 Tax=Apilactobacillus apisilvae TaxID=2923364 RepID=A0ABY4PGJ8_9LACO|nr:hypothetical protein [Apilactobacillus apisilvae]UQS84760.1 hypothetical protein MOO46_05815 [Apilactobacillus apisilvae]